MAVEIEHINGLRCQLGEGPVWDVIEQALFLVDIEGKQIHRLAWPARTIRSWTLPSMVGCIALRKESGAIVTLQDLFHTLDFETGETRCIGAAVHADPQMRFNDGKTDRQGRFYATTMDMKAQRRVGNLYRLDPDFSYHVVERGVTIGNGTCVSPDGCILYFCDTPRQVIWAYDHDADTGDLANRRLLVDTSHHGFRPDGCTVDGDGFLWSACPFVGRIVRYAPDGRVDRVIEMPTRYVSAAMFGGEALDVLFVTSIKESHFGEPDRDPLAGALFAVHGLGVRGVPEVRFTK